MKKELKDFFSNMILEDEDLRLDNWWIGTIPPCHDFNREIVEPGINETYPMGVLGIRVDDDFWQVAALPLKFSELSIEDLVEVLWPDIDDATFNEDSGRDNGS